MPTRFSRIKYGIRVLGATGEVVTKYKAFDAGTSDYTTTPQARGPSASATVEAFGFGGGETVIVQYSGRAASSLGSSGVSAAVLGHVSDPDATPRSGFLPAKAIIFNGDGGTATAKTSKITGLPYKKRGGESFTYPFGKTTATDGEFDRQSAIIAAVEANPNRSVSFKPERIYR